MASETLEKIDRARVMVAQLNYGERDWKPNHPPRDDDPDVVIHEALRSAALEISRLSRELEKARELLRELAGDVEAGLAWDDRWRCVYCDSRAHYTVLHDSECPIARARHFLADTDTEGGSRAAGRTRSTARSESDVG